MIIIEIQIKDQNKVKELFSQLGNRIENLMFALSQRIPQYFIPQFLMKWLDSYLTKRINQLKQQNIKNTWRNIYLKNVVNDINSRTQKEAPSDDD